jgi:hypothetical protein
MSARMREGMSGRQAALVILVSCAVMAVVLFCAPP